MKTTNDVDQLLDGLIIVRDMSQHGFKTVYAAFVCVYMQMFVCNFQKWQLVQAISIDDSCTLECVSMTPTWTHMYKPIHVHLTQ